MKYFSYIVLVFILSTQSVTAREPDPNDPPPSGNSASGPKDPETTTAREPDPNDPPPKKGKRRADMSWSNLLTLWLEDLLTQR